MKRAPILGRVSSRRVRLNGDYDSAGRYWGSGPPSLYRVSDEGELDEYVRADSSASAMDMVDIPMINRKKSAKREKSEAAREVSEKRAVRYLVRHGIRRQEYMDRGEDPSAREIVARYLRLTKHTRTRGSR